jgi:glutamate synthase domain-containing protein 3
MTGGVAVALGPVGWNAGAGMTGGVAYVTSWNQLNTDSVVAREVPSEDALELRALVEEHHTRTRSVLAAKLLADWTSALAAFRQLIPISVAYPPVTPAPSESLETAAKTTP